MDPARLNEQLPDLVAARDEGERLFSPEFVWPQRLKFQDRRWLHALLFVLTLGSTTLVGALHYEAFQADFLTPHVGWTLAFVARGLWYSLTIVGILGCHELGHYLACRYYDIDASLPYFIPAPLLTGTMGAFIRIRERIPSKRTLFDVGIAGPIAGFLVAVPALFIGVAMSHVVRVPPETLGHELGEPLLFKLASRMLWGSIPDGYSMNLHPIGFAAWWGLLATALNLFPIGQLDGGHISYAVLGRRSSHLTLAMIGLAVCLALFSSTSWYAWTTLMVVMLLLFGRHHPRATDEHVPLDRARLLLAICAVAIFALSFTPAPIGPEQIIGR